MIRLSRRYQAHLAVLFGMVLVPVLIHSYAGLRRDDCRHPESLAAFAGDSGHDVKRDKRIRSVFDAEAWWGGDLGSRPGGIGLQYAVVRSFNAKRLYYRPERRLLDEVPRSRTVEWLEADGNQIPLHRSYFDRGPLGRRELVVAYLLAYEGSLVDNGYLAQILNAPGQFFRGRPPMTLFLVWGEVGMERREHAESTAREWLVGAWRSYRDVCGS